MEDQRYPIGQFGFAGDGSPAQRAAWIGELAAAPALVRAAVLGLTDRQLDTPYRSGGWTVRQVVHHLPDSHLNAYLRFKLALTEANPTIKPYAEARWAELHDSRAPIDNSLVLLEALHRRWVALLESLGPKDFGRKYYHPENHQDFTLDQALAMYAWHGRHHTAHITELKRREGW